MSPRIRKLIGTVALLLLIAGYAVAVMLVGMLVLPHTGKLGELLFYACAGFVWVLPAGLLISWMHR